LILIGRTTKQMWSAILLEAEMYVPVLAMSTLGFTSYLHFGLWDIPSNTCQQTTCV